MDLIDGPHDPPLPRRLEFDFARPCPPDWMAGSLPYSCLLNAYSIVFPALETIMVRHVARAARRVPADTDLAAVRGFLQQEGSHAREHRRSMECISAQGFRVTRTHNLTHLLVRLTDALLHRVLRPLFGHGFAVAIFAAAEHWTASLAETSLRPSPWLASVGRLDQPEPPGDLSEMEVLFLWHVAEELEHKTVVADLFDTLGGSQLSRVGGFLLATPVFLLLTAIGFASMLAQSPRVLGPVEWRRIGRWRGLLRLVRTDLQEIPGTYRATIRSYLRRGFHPSDHDTEALVGLAFLRLAQLRTEQA
ncbi:putative metal-dependent hydrolase [Allocatelliglobosispora scoriae]|uniref:Putative metal-dependent hydrolase n=1 Tax=Allocatelliglobosispora scoriae TaxID=643052 RepID=A0A841C3C3_9ACTN|nr:metal-dependent hydrolase [Allocatelliglobosispora scoriae]MBB5874268.1 putative metal-dependent hydrolase [Allocatelliglobosispora scoriae]